MNKFLNIDEGMKRWGSDSQVNKLKKDKHKEKPAKKTKKNPVNLFKDTFTRRYVYTSIYSKIYVNGHSKIDKTKVIMTNGSLMKVKSIAECCLDWLQSLKHFFINVSYHILVASLTLVARF